MRLLGVLFFMIASSSAYAFHPVKCQNDDLSVRFDGLSDAKFGVIINGQLSYGGKQAHFSHSDAGDDDKDGGASFAKHKIAVLPFKSGENLVITTGEKFAVAFDSEGNFLAKLTCRGE